MSAFERLREGGQELQCGGLPQLQGGDREGEAADKLHQNVPVRQGVRSSVQAAGRVQIGRRTTDRTGKVVKI